MIIRYLERGIPFTVIETPGEEVTYLIVPETCCMFDVVLYGLVVGV